MDAQTEKVISVFSDFLNAWSDSSDYPEGKVTRDDFEPTRYGPRLIVDLDHTWASGTMRVITMFVDPFQDEGGANFLTAIFGRLTDEHLWELLTLVQYFDTETHTLIDNGRRTAAWPQKG